MRYRLNRPAHCKLRMHPGIRSGETGMDFELPEELQMIQKQLRRFVDTEVIPIEREIYDGPSIRPEMRARLEAKTKAMGLWNLDTPSEYGGLGLGLLARTVIWEEMARSI